MLVLPKKIIRRMINKINIPWVKNIWLKTKLGFKQLLTKLILEYLAPHIFKQHETIASPIRHIPHLQVLRNRYYSLNKQMGDSTEKFMLDGTLKASQLATFEVLYYETDFSSAPWSDLNLLTKCDQIKPDAIILSSWNDRDWRHPNPETLRFLRERWQIPLITIWWDTCSKGFWGVIEPVLPFIDLNIVPDNPNSIFMDPNSPYFERFLSLWTPLDPLIYHNKGIHRDIPVSFLGQVASYRSNRMEYIQHLIDNKIPIRLSTSNRVSQPSHTDYVDTLQRSQIGINFSYSVDCHQLKGRVFETMLCGAMLMESENDQTSRYFVPMQDYVSFSSKEDLLEKLHYYIEHDDERIAIAARGEQKARELYNHYEFWRAVLDKLTLIQQTMR